MTHGPTRTSQEESLPFPLPWPKQTVMDLPNFVHRVAGPKSVLVKQASTSCICRQSFPVLLVHIPHVIPSTRPPPPPTRHSVGTNGNRVTDPEQRSLLARPLRGMGAGFFFVPNAERPCPPLQTHRRSSAACTASWRQPTAVSATASNEVSRTSSATFLIPPGRTMCLAVHGG